MKCPEGKDSVFLFWSREDLERHDIWVYFDTSREKQDDKDGLRLVSSHPLHERLRTVIALFPQDKDHQPISAEEYETITEGIDHEMS